MKKIIKALVIIPICLFLLTGCGGDTEYTSKDKYAELNIQQMHNDYDSNEITAKDKYEYKYYYFTGEIDEVVEHWGDIYLEFMFHSDNPNAKTTGIELTAYFANADMLKSVTKGQTVTVYCKFKERSIENYMGTSGYSLHSCHFGDHFSETNETSE